jgi:hypothetical protein
MNTVFNPMLDLKIERVIDNSRPTLAGLDNAREYQALVLSQTVADH